MMDQAVTRAVGATPSTIPPAAAPRLLGEFQGYVDGEPSVAWADRKSMPAVGSKLFALPPRSAVPRTWSLLLTSQNHGVVGAPGSMFDSVPETYERVQVMEIVEAGAAPAPGADLVGLVRLPLTNEQIAAGAAIECDHGAPIGRNAAIDVFDAMCAAAPVAAQAGQVAVPEGDCTAHHFRKKPVVIEAIQWGGDQFVGTAPAWIGDAITQEPGTPGFMMRIGEKIVIETLEGQVWARAGDWIIRGVKGELYPCKPDIFAATYELAAAPSAPAVAQQAPADFRDVTAVKRMSDQGLHLRFTSARACSEFERAAQASTAGERQEGGAA